jgi:hypothetical protein
MSAYAVRRTRMLRHFSLGLLVLGAAVTAMGGLSGCSGATPAAESSSSSSSGALVDVEGQDASADAPADAPTPLAPEFVAGFDTPGSSCDAFCKGLGTTCSAACPTSRGAAAGYVNERSDRGPLSTRFIATCSETVQRTPNALAFTGSCCCVVRPSKQITEELRSARTCDDMCGAQGLKCEGRGTIDFRRADGTFCSTTLACDEARSPTSACAQKPSVGAKQTCTCR